MTWMWFWSVQVDSQSILNNKPTVFSLPKTRPSHYLFFGSVLFILANCCHPLAGVIGVLFSVEFFPAHTRRTVYPFWRLFMKDTWLKRRTTAFTLVELLVVIAIIAILIGLL